MVKINLFELVNGDTELSNNGMFENVAINWAENYAARWATGNNKRMAEISTLGGEFITGIYGSSTGDGLVIINARGA